MKKSLGSDESSSTDNEDKSSAPLIIPAELDAWMLDVPYVCESGNNGMAEGCPETTARTDETITRLVNTFDVFVEADRTFNGQTYQVLFGGFEWGFTFTATDTPEPSTWAMLGLGFLGLGALALSRRERRLAV
jgi:hypothetical protein